MPLNENDHNQPLVYSDNTIDKNKLKKKTTNWDLGFLCYVWIPVTNLWFWIENQYLPQNIPINWTQDKLFFQKYDLELEGKKGI